MKLPKLILVSGNKAKAIEFQRVLSLPIEIIELDLPEIQSLNLKAVTLDKVERAFEKVKRPVFVDDVSVELDAWNGFPGPLVKWTLKAGNNDASLVLKLLNNETNRKAKAKLGIGFHDGKNARVFIGETFGSIAKEIRGNNGFGWDPVFIPKGSNKTFAEMSHEEKDAISHRGKALAKVKDFLKKNYEI